MIAIVNHGTGNLKSVKNMLDYLGVDSIITSNPEDLLKADKVILPGVGAFGQVMNSLREKKLDFAIKKVIENKKPFLGICVGFQVLFEESEESPGIKGLGIFKGKVKKFKQGKVPPTGWNKILAKKENSYGEGYVYYVNAYYPCPENKKNILFESAHHIPFCGGFEKDNVLGVQFHPELSGNWGINFYKKWLKGEKNG